MLYYRDKKNKKKLASDNHKGIVLFSAAVIFCISAGSVFGTKDYTFESDTPETVTVFNYDSEQLGSVAEENSDSANTNAETDASDTAEISFAEPAQGVLTSGFGSRWGRDHTGIDIGGSEGSDIYAAVGGIVSYADWMGGYGNYVVIDHGNGLQTAYGHCSKLLVSEGDYVERGQIIAYMGSTGNSTGPHLHFEVKQDGVFQNPLDYVLY